MLPNKTKSPFHFWLIFFFKDSISFFFYFMYSQYQKVERADEEVQVNFHFDSFDSIRNIIFFLLLKLKPSAKQCAFLKRPKNIWKNKNERNVL